MKFIEDKRDLSKLSTFSESSIVKFIENQSEHLSKLTLYHLKKRATRQSRRAREPSRTPLLFLRDLNKKNSMFGRNLSSKRFQRYHARYKCNNKRRDSKIINLNKMARKQIRGDLKAHLAIEMSLNKT